MALSPEIFTEMDRLVLEEHIPHHRVAKILGCGYNTVRARYIEKIEFVPKACNNPACDRAGQILQASDFYRNCQTKDGHDTYCKECTKAQKRMRMASAPGESRVYRDPIEMAMFACPTCGMWADSDTGMAFQTQAEADMCCADRGVEHTVPGKSDPSHNIAKYDKRPHISNKPTPGNMTYYVKHS